MSEQIATIPNDAQNITECAPGTRTIEVARLVTTDQAVEDWRDATGPTIAIDTVQLVKYRKGNQLLFGAYYAPDNRWFIAL